jgi:imidazole glycerol-phosphate synthase subunit HisF
MQMLNKRIIARLDIKGPNLVKGIHLEGLRVLGSPSEFARYYYENGADELMYVDAVASLYERNSLLEIVEKTAKESFIPLTVGGGIRTIEDIRNILRTGADKVSINTAAIKNPDFIREAANRFGSSTIVVTIEAIKSGEGTYLAFTDNGREFTGINAIEWAEQLEELGAGELVVTSVDREGTGQGYDLELTERISKNVSIPVIAHGGAGKIQHVCEVFQKSHADAVAVASLLHYETIKRIQCMRTTEDEGNIEFLKSGMGRSTIQEEDIGAIKEALFHLGIPCRHNIHH